MERIFSLCYKWKRACWLWYPDICLSLSVMKAWSVLRVQIGSAFHSDTCMSLMTPVPKVGSSSASPFLYYFPQFKLSAPLKRAPILFQEHYGPCIPMCGVTGGGKVSERSVYHMCSSIGCPQWRAGQYKGIPDPTAPKLPLLSRCTLASEEH